jgi:NAD(P)-dependent dehydrogenase (short-subunit alcohol dehydrogenase family)
MLITGVSSGLGKALAEEGLYQGWRVVGTLRKEADRQNFEAINPGHAIGRILDVTDTAAVPKSLPTLRRRLDRWTCSSIMPGTVCSRRLRRRHWTKSSNSSKPMCSAKSPCCRRFYHTCGNGAGDTF